MDGSQSVQAAVIVRPLVTHELLVGCSDCITVTPGEPQVKIGSHSFKFDYVYDSTPGSASGRIFDDCVAPLVDALYHGYNATVLAYGQTGSGKTYVMGTDYNGESTSGIIPKVMQKIFRHVEETKGNTEYLIRVSFVEIYKDKVFDLLESGNMGYPKADGNQKRKRLSRAPIQIRETADGRILLANVTEAKVTSQEEMASFLSRGSALRATGSTNMNSQSSRSHAIFTISMEQKRIAGGGHDDGGDDTLSAKLHLVDLAGSERAKKTGADGMRLREGININEGLLALGNVISALGDNNKRKEGGHVPYRDSKLTRLLQDSLGGNSKTVMIACVSPADSNAEETLNTLKYANRARNIQNKAIVNRDPVTAQMQRMTQIEGLQAELPYPKGQGDSSTLFEENQTLKQTIALLEARNASLEKQLQEHQVNVEQSTKQATDAQILKQKNNQVLEIRGKLKQLVSYHEEMQLRCRLWKVNSDMLAQLEKDDEIFSYNIAKISLISFEALLSSHGLKLSDEELSKKMRSLFDSIEKDMEEYFPRPANYVPTKVILHSVSFRDVVESLEKDLEKISWEAGKGGTKTT